MCYCGVSVNTYVGPWLLRVTEVSFQLVLGNEHESTPLNDRSAGLSARTEFNRDGYLDC